MVIASQQTVTVLASNRERPTYCIKRTRVQEPQRRDLPTQVTMILMRAPQAPTTTG
jgi:hypothetical protein